MAKMLEALLHLQTIERQLATVRGRLRARKNAVLAQQANIDHLSSSFKSLHERYISRRKDGDRMSLELKTREAQVAKLRTSLNSAKTNKEYAAVLTQINTLKADNAKMEEEALRVMQDADSIKTHVDEAAGKIEIEKARLDGIEQTSAEEIKRLTLMMEDLSAKRAEAAKQVPPHALAMFDRIAENYDGEGMAAIETHGDKPPHEYICGGCFMSLTAEHVNALRTKDEIRTCDNCGRILYLEVQTEGSTA